MNPKAIKQSLSRYHIYPKKRRGQNFLVNRKVLNDFIAAAELSPRDFVLEIGAGTGIITVELARRVEKVLAVEKDTRLLPILREALEEAELNDRVEIISADIMEIRIMNYELRIMGSQMLKLNGQELKIVGAIPYQITSPLIHKFLKLEEPPRLIVFIIQNEVAEKIATRPPQANYLGNFVQALAEVELVGRPINPAAFWPSPKVNSRIIRIKPKVFQETKINDVKEWEKFLHRAFGHPRKMLKSVFPEARLKKAGIEPSQRPQEIELENWKLLYDNQIVGL